jgi:hypothetical protein
MNKKLEELTNALKAENIKYERNVKTIERDIKAIENSIQELSNELAVKVINKIVGEIYSIKQSIDNWNYFNFDGYVVNRKENVIILYISDKAMNKYEINFIKCEFRYIGVDVSDEFTYEMEVVLRNLNSIFNFDEQ